LSEINDDDYDDMMIKSLKAVDCNLRAEVSNT